ncbi:MAG: phospholipid carrier-dependent glycosyltransferase [Bryobacterales bacterium]|nr:phospholipid carrier-dependent glycosyltransferase [Bryobacterales bacterium]
MPPSWKSPFVLCATALLAVCAALQVGSIRQESQTWDEAVEIAGGYRYLKTGENRFFLEHPPLGRILVALPLLLLDPALPASEAQGHIAYGADFLYRNRVPADTMLSAARSVTIAVTLALGLALAMWVKRKWGATAALFALALYVFDPNILAQGRYTKSGLLLTLLCFLACVAWSEYLEQPARAWLLATGILFGLAISTKYSAAFLLPAFAVLALVHGWCSGVYPWRAWMRALCVVSGIGAILLLSMFAPEGKALLPRTRGSLAGWGPAESLRSQVDQSTLTGRAIAFTGAHLGWRRHTMLVGMAEFAAYNQRGHEAYLLGMHSPKGWWYFFPVAFAVKTPVASLALILLALLTARRTRLRQVPFAVWTMAVPLAIYVAICFMSHVDTGLRHLLPAYPFLFALMGAALSSVPWRWPAIVLVCLAAVETMAVYPHFTAFFNVAAGGPAQGPRYLVDSSLDWGQDLKKLKRYMDEQGIEQVRLAYFGTAEPEYYGIRSVPLIAQKDANSGGVVAVSATFLHGLYVPESRYAWLRQRTPSARIGYSIYVYDLR